MSRSGFSFCRILRLIVCVFSGAVLLFVCSMVFFILLRGLPELSPDLFSLRYTPENLSLLPALINTLSLTFISLIIASPLGIAAAVYLCEYADSGCTAVRLIRLSAEVLSGVPSIVYAVFGAALFVRRCGLGFSLLSGGLTLAIMILPTIISTSEEALRSLPEGLRMGGFGLGASKTYVIFRLLLPAAARGISGGIILSAGRIAAETAALIYTAGTAARIASPLHSGRTIAVHIYTLCCEGQNSGKAYACAAVLIVVIIIINIICSAVFSHLFRADKHK